MTLHQPRPRTPGSAAGQRRPHRAGGPTASRAGPTPTAPGSTTPRSRSQADVDTELMLEEGALVLERAPRRGRPHRRAAGRARRRRRCGLRDTTRPAGRAAQGRHRPLGRGRARRPPAARPRHPVGRAAPARRARAGALPAPGTRSSRAARARPTTRRSTAGPPARSRTAAQRLPAIAAMGFDVVYLTPVHPIGQAAKKGPNNTLDARPEDPGSPYAIGSADGGHDAIHPDLGTFEDFDAFVAESRRLGHGGRHGPRAAVLPRPPVGDRPTPSGSPPAPTAPSPTPRTRRRSTRTSTR